jgi:predicted ATPase/signal transduction histidine kinase
MSDSITHPAEVPESDAPPGGLPLDRLLGEPMEMALFLRIAGGLSRALGTFHARGFIHGDIKAENLVVDPESGRVWLRGMGLAARTLRQRLQPQPFDVLTGTLSHLAPERTGRMNRSMDARSDLYSVGVTLYQMLTGALPFAATSPIEWVHCHIARTALPPSTAREGVPEVVSNLVQKLLAKTAEERYQTAAGLGLDLQRCADAWAARGVIEPFALGERDVPDRLLIPETLYGRETEIALLLAAFDRVVKGAAPELVLVSGYSGVGKSSVVNELHKALVPPRGLFAEGKFDQYKRGIPYATLAQAFQQLVRQILAESDAEVARWRSEISLAVGNSGQLIVALIPELERIIGPQPPVPELSTAETGRRFQRVLERFIGVFARPEHPLALFLDDLQWLDAATLEVLQHLLGSADVKSLLLVGAYRDNEVDAEHPLARVLAEIRGAGARVHEIVLAPLALRDVEALVIDALRCERSAAAPLARLLHEKTGGNPFFTIQFLAMLAEAELLVFQGDLGAWSWDLERIRARHYTDNVVVLMAGKLGRLPAPAQLAVQRFACLGNAAERSTLAMGLGQAPEQTDALLAPAALAGLVIRVGSSWAFLHDQVQEAAYASIAEEDRAATHLLLGRHLAAMTAPGDLEERIFEIVNQLNRGAALVDDEEEREQVARLNLVAGKRARSSTAYVSALAYLTTGRSLLSDAAWERDRSLVFELELELAHCEFLTGEQLVALTRLMALARREHALPDRARVTCLQVTVYTALDRSEEAIGACFDYLRGIGIDWPMHPPPDLVRAEYEAIRARLGMREIEQLALLPRSTDPEVQATMDVLTAVGPASLYIDGNLNGLVACRMVNLSLEHGNCDASCYAYIIFAMNLGSRYGTFGEAFRFGKLAHDLVERGFTTFAASTLMCFGSILGPWGQHARAGRPLVRRAFTVARETGDLPFAAYSCGTLVTNLLFCADPLDEVQREAEEGLTFTRQARIELGADFLTSQLRLIMSLRGLTPTFGSFTDASFEEATFEDHLGANPSLSLAACWYWIRKLQARFHAGAFAEALAAAAKAGDLLWTCPTFLEAREYHLYAALSAAGQHGRVAPEERAELLAAVRVHHDQMEAEARICPENYESRACLVGAEIARIEGRAMEAMGLYERAIQSARRHGFVHHEATANELLAGFYATEGMHTSAQAHLRDARDGYRRWGAQGKVRQLAHSDPHLREESAATALSLDTSVGQIDFDAVMKMSLAVSGEMALDRLIERLMVLALEHAGAVRGVLVVPDGGELRLEAEATTGRSSVDVVLRRTAVTADELPQTILRFVARSLERVVLGDALGPHEFSLDPYLARRRPRSVLCLPLVKQARLMGVLYLENDLSAHLFTPPRIAMLQLLASQAAISLENARLYGNIQQAALENARLYGNIQQAQAELAHVTRVSTMGELAASIAHEVSQPVVGVITNGNAGLRWLARGTDNPHNIDEVRAALERIMRDGTRARVVIERIRTLFKKREIAKEPLDLDDAVDEVLVLVRGEAERRGVAIHRQPAFALPPIVGDRVQLQQVVMNLLMNAIDATSAVEDRARDVLVGTRLLGDEAVTFVTDSGVGLDPETLGQLFVAFHTTKPDGMGMGLSISRSIVENHQGRLWAEANPGHGATFQFALPTKRGAAPRP